MADVTRNFKRPRTPAQYEPIKQAVSRAVKDKTLQQFKCAYVYKKGWFQSLGDDWTPKDACLYFMIALSGFHRAMVTRKNDAELLRTLARALNNLTFEMRNASDQLIERAELLEAVEETEAAD